MVRRAVLKEQSIGDDATGLIGNLYEQHNGTLIAHMEASGEASRRTVIRLRFNAAIGI